MSRDRRQPDHFTRRAKREGRPARSVYKLEEIDQRWHLLGKGRRVLDLGASPGSWMQYAAEHVGPTGRVIGYDLKPLEVALPAHAVFEIADVFALDAAALGGPFDVVLSDMAPSTMGDHTTDALRSAALAERALDVADAVLVAGGNVVVKVLEGGDVPAIAVRIRQSYSKLERLRPEATRKSSTEIFLVGLGKK